MMSKIKNIVKYDRDGHADHTQICTGDSLKIERKPTEEDEEDDFCNVCQEDLFFSSQITKRIAILDRGHKEVKGWICPYCFTEFDNRDNILVLMSKSAIQGKA